MGRLNIEAADSLKIQGEQLIVDGHNDWRSISERIACTYGGRCTWLSGNHAVEVLDGPTKPICEGHCLLIPSRRTQLRTLSYAAVEVVGDWRGDPHIEIVSFPRRRAGEKVVRIEYGKGPILVHIVDSKKKERSATAVRIG